MSLKLTLKLNTGHSIPATGFGTWQAGLGEVRQAVYEALKIGYRHLDFAPIYFNQHECGEAIRRAMADFGIKREEIFITSKLWCSSQQPENVHKALDETLAQLGLEYLDLYLIHWPVCFKAGESLQPVGPDGFMIMDKSVSLSQTWKAVTELPKSKVRSVGVSNFTVEHLEQVIKDTGVVPAMNQIERHPQLPDFVLIDYCRQKGILTTAYSAFGNNHFNIPLLVNQPEVQAAAANFSKRHGKLVTPAQILTAWARWGGHTVIPKSVKPSRIAENFVEVELDEEAYKELNVLGETRPMRFNTLRQDNIPVKINIFNTEQEQDSTPVVLSV